MARKKSCWSGGKQKPSEEQVRKREHLRNKLGQGDFPEQCPDDLGGRTDDDQYWLDMNLIQQFLQALGGGNAG